MSAGQFSQAQDLKRGQWLLRRNGAYLIDAVEVRDGIVYVGTIHGVLTLLAHEPVYPT